MLVAGDVGGTKTTLAVYSSEAGPRNPLAQATFLSARYRSVLAMLREFLVHVRLPVTHACLGVAGPVVGGHATVTNLPWSLDEDSLKEALGLDSVRILNDLESTAYAIPLLAAADVKTLNGGLPVPGGAVAVIAPGTGLGEAFLTWDGRRYRAHASEGGHVDFGPTNAQEIELLHHMLQRMPHVSYERLCSGIGLPNIYSFLKSAGREEPAWLAAKLAVTVDQTPVIVDAALAEEQRFPIAREALDQFVSILGAEAGNLALKVLAIGGVYLAGGIPPRILPALQSATFMRAFQNKGRFGDLLGRVPVHVILTPDLALLGAASVGLEKESS